MVGKTEQPFDAWGEAFNSYVLAKQAGLNMNFSYINSPLPESKLYIMPCVSDFEFFEAFRFDALMEKVAQGATLYVSLKDPYINGYDKFFGAELICKYNNTDEQSFTLDGTSFNIASKAAIELEPITAEVISVNSEGRPCLLKNKYGKGTVYLLTAPLESYISTISNAPDNFDYYKIYSLLSPQKDICSNNKSVCITKHDDIYVAINYSDTEITNPINTRGCQPEALWGDIGCIEPFGVCVFKVKN